VEVLLSGINELKELDTSVVDVLSLGMSDSPWDPDEDAEEVSGEPGPSYRPFDRPSLPCCVDDKGAGASAMITMTLSATPSAAPRSCTVARGTVDLSRP